MYEALKSRLSGMLSRPRPLKPQTERQLAQYLSEHRSTAPAFLLCAASVLEEYELEVLFGPLFTPGIQERAEVADLLYHWRPTGDQLNKLVVELGEAAGCALVQLPDGTEAPLTLHEVMLERFVRLLRLEHAPEPTVSAALREALPADLWPLAVALLCEPGVTVEHQRWIADFTGHLAAKRVVTGRVLETVIDFVSRQVDLKPGALVGAAESLMKATEGTAAYAAAGHAYWSPDVAQHHHYRGQGTIDAQRVEERQAEVQCVAGLLEGLRSFAREVGAH